MLASRFKQHVFKRVNPMRGEPPLKQRWRLGLTWVPKPMYVYVHTVRSKGRMYKYLVVEEYLGHGKRRTILRMRLEDAVKKLLADTQEGGTDGAKWCGGRDLNPRRPTPSGPQPDPFGQARAPPHLGACQL